MIAFPALLIYRKIRLALFKERGKSFLRFRRQQHGAEAFVFGGDRRQRCLHARLLHQRLGGAHRCRRQGDQARRLLLGEWQQFSGAKHFRDQAHVERFHRSKAIPEQQLFGGARVAGQLREQQAGTEFRAKAKLRERHREFGRVGAVDQVAVQQQRGADADCRARDSGDDRFGAADQGAHELEHSAVFRLHAGHGRRVLHEVIEVVASRENLGLAGNQDRADGGVGVGGDQGVGHRLVHDRGDGVLAAWAVELEGQQAGFCGGEDVHFFVSLFIFALAI